MSKVIEEIASSRILSHLADSNRSDPFQSAYRKNHSTETALLSILNDILTAMEKGRITALTLLDLSAAFDTIDHTILLGRLQNLFGMSGHALNRLPSYSTGRSQKIKLKNVLSPEAQLPFGVTQGSVLGPLLFTLYTTPLSTVVQGHSILHYLYADDSQLYIRLTSDDSASQLDSLKAYLDSILTWMLYNRLKIEPTIQARLPSY